MPKKVKNGNGNGGKRGSSPDLWIAPNHSLKCTSYERVWVDRRRVARDSSRLIELADIALGLKKPSQRKSKAAAGQPSDETKD